MGVLEYQHTLSSYRLLTGWKICLPQLLLILFAVSAARAVDCDPPPSGIVGWWPGEGNAWDVIGTNNGTLMGGATANAPGVVGSAFQFDGTNGYVRFPDSPAFHPANLTVEAWILFRTLNTPASGTYPGQDYIVFKQNSRSSYFEGIALEKDRYPPNVGTNDTFCWETSSSSGQLAFLESVTVIKTNVWYFVVGVRGSNFLQLYVNGKLEAQTNVHFAQDYGNLPLYFGTSGQSYYDCKFGGLLDEVSLYNRALTSDEIAAIYAASSAGKCRSLASSSTSLSLSTNLAVYGASVTFTSTVTGSGPAPTGTVAFMDGASTLGTGSLNGSSVATFSTNKLSVTASPHSTKAVYGGDVNYTGSTSGPVSLTITAATVTPGVTVSNKTYDGTITATISNRVLVGVVSGDDVNLGTSGAASFNDRNAGTGKAVTVTGLSLSGTTAGNYQLSVTTANTTANISAEALAVKAVANTKPYDGATAAAAVPIIASGSLQSPDTANFLETYDTRNVGSGKTLMPGGAINDGNGGNNYQATYVSTNTGIISPVTLTVTADNKTRWFGAANPVLTAQFSGFVAGENENILAGSPDLHTAATLSSVPGGYPITVGVGNLTATNYTFGFVDGTLTILTLPQLSVDSANGDLFIFSFPTISGQVYQVEHNSNLASGIWMPVGGLIDGSGSPVAVTNDLNDPEGYFRLNLQP
jgi:hypothetical protein